MKYEFPVTLTKNPKQNPSEGPLASEPNLRIHMFIMDYNQEEGWHNGRIVPLRPD